jgi:hypothetical protein
VAVNHRTNVKKDAIKILNSNLLPIQNYKKNTNKLRNIVNYSTLITIEIPQNKTG